MRRSFPVLAVKSFAKVNLYLRILGRRKDNFHNLDTLFARIDLHDTIRIRHREDGLIKIYCANPDVPEDSANLCSRAAEALRKKCRIGSGLDIKIDKRIPVGAGLGGGSSNAASVLLALNKYWHLRLSRKELSRIGSRIGSDVPFFIYETRFALGGAKGDRITPLDYLKHTKLWFVLVYPGIKVSTPFVYKKFDSFLLKCGKKSLPCGNISRLTRNKRDVKILLYNDLESITSSLYPLVKRVKGVFCSMGLEKAMMSGSGPTVFAICDGRAHAKDLSNKLRSKHKSWQVFLSSSV
ncbi:MAG: 4-(cytidine 5'-diphospho)-2-C-methyl-D-erythritol kinase [Candidatus Omnitrophota bacterium]